MELVERILSSSDINQNPFTAKLNKVERRTLILTNMEEGETVPIPSRKELRKQKLMEYLAAKGKLKVPNPKAYLRDDCPAKKPVTTIVKEKENKIPAEKFRYEGVKVAQSTKYPARRAFGITNNVDAKGSILAGRQNNSCPSATRGPARPNLNQNPLLRGTYTVAYSKSSLNAATNVKKQPNTGMQASGQASSNVGHTAIVTSNTRFTSSLNATLSVPVKTVSVRMSLGPMVKTRTGLIPAVTQPKNTNSHLTHTSVREPDATTSVTSKIPSRGSSVSVSQRSAIVQRKILSTTAVDKPVNARKTALSAKMGKVQDQSHGLVQHSQPPCKSQLSSGIKAASVSSKCKAAPVKPEGKVGMSKTNQSAGQPTDRSTRQRSERDGQKNNRLSKVSSERSMSRKVSEVTRSAVAEPAGKTVKCKETQSKNRCGSAHVPSQQTNTKRTGFPVMSQTAPQPVRTISLTGKPTEKKTPKVQVRIIPQTEGKKVTAAQEERMKKLKEWREAKGISYKRPPMPVKPQVRRTIAVTQPFWTAMKEEDEAHSLICAVDRSLADCIKLLGEGCPPDQVKEVLARLPVVSQKFAKYWICQARLVEQEGNLDVLPLFKEAVRVVLEPVDELRTVVFEILKKKDEMQENDNNEHQMPADDGTDESCINPMMTPKPVRALICGEKGNSSIVKYKITATPGGPPSQQREPARINGQEVRFFTPVRRSVRIERASLRYPASLQDHDVCVASYNDLISEEDKERSQEQEGGEGSPSANDSPLYIYRENEALKDKVFVQLVCDEGVSS